MHVVDAAAAVLAAAERPQGCGADHLALLEATDPASLDDPLARIAYIKVLNRVEAAVAARRYDAVLSLVPVLPHAADYVQEDHWEASSPRRAGPRSVPRDR